MRNGERRVSNTSPEAMTRSQLIEISESMNKSYLSVISAKERMIANQQTWNFKSKEPKVAIYKDEEKRQRMLYGSKNHLKYKIKLNDQILEPIDHSTK